MLKAFLGLFGLASGPVGWVATAVSWGSTAAKWAVAAFEWCVKHWKIVLAALALAWAFAYGYHWRGEKDKKDVQRAHEETVAAKKALDDYKTLIATNQAVEDAERGAKEQDDTAAAKRQDADRTRQIHVLETENKKLAKGLEDYVQEHSKPAAAGACPTDTDIGDDGVLLIERAVAARGLLRAGASDGRGNDAVPGTRPQGQP